MTPYPLILNSLIPLIKSKLHNKPDRRCKKRIVILDPGRDGIASIGLNGIAVGGQECSIILVSPEGIFRDFRVACNIPIGHIDEQVQGRMFKIPFFVDADV